MSEEKVTIRVAAKALNVSTKTIHRWLANGTLTRIKEGPRTYIAMDEIRTLRQRHKEDNKKDDSDIFNIFGQGQDIVPIKREHYEGLLTRLGQLENEKSYLLEYKEGLEQKDKELVETKANLAIKNKELLEIKSKMENSNDDVKNKSEELEKLKEKIEHYESRSLWQRIFNKF